MLIVEDQETMRSKLREFLQQAFPEKQIREAGDGRTALALCHQYRPSVVLMDIGLPDLNGIELTSRIKAMAPETTVIVVSAHTNRVYVERAIAAGASAFVEKHLVQEKLLTAVQRALGNSVQPGSI